MIAIRRFLIAGGWIRSWIGDASFDQADVQIIATENSAHGQSRIGECIGG